MRKTWGQIKAGLGEIADYCGSSGKLLALANEAMEALWAEGDWVGKFARYKIRICGDCRGNRCITWPRQIEAIEGASICNTIISTRNVAFEFIENAVGPIENACSSLLGDRQEVISFEDILPGSKKLKVYATVVEDANAKVLLLGYDDNDVWIRTLIGGVWYDGEFVNLVNGSPATSTNFFSRLIGIQFGQFANGEWTVTERNGNVYLYEVDTLDGNSERWLSTYEYNETIPVYRRSILTNLGAGDVVNEDNANCHCMQVLARLRFQPVKLDTDYVQISQEGAIKEMIFSILRRNNDKLTEAEGYRQRALRLLNNELRQYKGNAPRQCARMMTGNLWLAAHNYQ